MVRFTDYCVNNNLPIIETIEPLQLKEIRGIKTKAKKDMFEFEGEGHWIKDVQWEKKIEAVVANAECRLEISENVFKVPMATESKSDTLYDLYVFRRKIYKTIIKYLFRRNFSRNLESNRDFGRKGNGIGTICDPSQLYHQESRPVREMLQRLVIILAW